jgi:hypothetical protein
MSLRHDLPPQPGFEGPDVPRHDVRTAPENTDADIEQHDKLRRRALQTLSGLGAVAVLIGGGAVLKGGSHHDTVARPPQATGKAFDTPSAAVTTPASKAPQVADIPSSILLGDVYKNLDAKAQADIMRMDTESPDTFKREPRPKRMFYGEVFDKTFEKATAELLTQYAVDGDPNRLIPKVDSDGQQALNDVSFKVDESYRSLMINGNPNNLTTNTKQRESAIKALGSVVFETNETLPYGNPYPAMEAAIQNATSFTPSRGSETNFTAPDIDYRDTGGWIKGGATEANGKKFDVGGADANGDDFMVIDNEPYGTSGALQYDFVKEKDAAGKEQTVLVSIMNATDQFRSSQAPDIDPNTGVAVGSGEGAGW